MVPSWITAVNAAPGSSQPSRAGDDAEVPAARDRQELGQALHDAQHRRLDQIHVTSFPSSARAVRLPPRLGALGHDARQTPRNACGGQRSAAHEGGDERALPEGTGDRDRIGGGATTSPSRAGARRPSPPGRRARRGTPDASRSTWSPTRTGRPATSSGIEHRAGAGR